VLAGAAAAVLGSGGAETGAVLAGSATVAVGSGGAETGAVLADSAAAAGDGGAKTGVVLACAARLGTGTSALGESLSNRSEKSVIKPIPKTTEKMTNPNSASTASTRALTLTLPIFLNARNILAYVSDGSLVIATAEPTMERDVATAATAKFDVLMDFSFEFVDFGEPGCKWLSGHRMGALILN
jgi:hypothetical protein